MLPVKGMHISWQWTGDNWYHRQLCRQQDQHCLLNGNVCQSYSQLQPKYLYRADAPIVPFLYTCTSQLCCRLNNLPVRRLETKLNWLPCTKTCIPRLFWTDGLMDVLQATPICMAWANASGLIPKNSSWSISVTCKTSEKKIHYFVAHGLLKTVLHTIPLLE